MANCHKCKVILTLENCGSSRFINFGAAAYCRPCDKAKNRKYVIENRDKLRQKQKEYCSKDPEKWKEYNRIRVRDKYRSLSIEERRALRKSRATLEWRHRSRKYNYGIEPEEFIANLEAQGSKCCICNKILILDSSDKNEKPHQDHDHETGKNRGILCNLCNSFLGLAQDKIEILASAIRYLQKHAIGSSIQTESVVSSAE